MSWAVVGAFTAAAAMLSENIKAEVVSLQSDGVSDAVVGGGAHAATL